MKNWFNSADAADIRRRLDGLKPESRPQWGNMSAGEVLCHLADTVRVPLGEKDTKRKSGPFGIPGIAHMVVWVAPWPKGAPTAPEFLPGAGMTTPEEFGADKQALLAALERLSRTGPDQALPPSPVFGRLSRRAWGRLMWRHLDHHLRQFGL